MDFSKRVKDQVPTVLLTLLSIVQALALELMWAYITEATGLFHFTFYALLGWIQVATTLLGILLVWLIYATMVMRFRWIPTTMDLTFPFIVGILEFLLIATLAPEDAGPWFVTMGIVFGAMTWSSQTTLRCARQDAENDAYFAGTHPATWRDFLGAAATVTIMLVAGLYLWQYNNQDWLLLVALLGAFGALTVQMWMTNNFWRNTFDRLGKQQSATVEQK